MRSALSVLALLALCGLLSAAPASAAVCAIETAPAATLLLPSFEVNLACNQANGGITTLFSINNASANATLAHIVLWSDLSVPVLDFTIYLTGYDVQSFNLCDLLVNGLLPQTASTGQDPSDIISPKGPLSQDVNFASCTGQLPPGTLPSTFTAHLQSSLTGQFSTLLGGCAGLAYGDNIARGYVTVDTVNNCTLRFPSDPGYFAPAGGGSGDATDQNVLLGDYSYVNSAASFAQGYTMVHLQADPNRPETSTSGQYTFYGRYVNWTAIDHREPLPTRFFARYFNSGVSGTTTTMTAWRDPKVVQNPFHCGTLPFWYPLGQARVVAFDEQEHVAESASPIFPFPGAVGKIQVGSANLPTPFSFGWILYDLNSTVGGAPPVDPLAEQAWVTLSMSVAGLSLGYPAFQLDTCPGAVPPPAGSTAFYSIPPCRLLDTRGADGPALLANAARRITAAGRCGVPATARTVAANLTVVNASAGGDLRLFPAGSPLPPTSTINFAGHQTRANNAILSLSPDGEFAVWSDQAPAATVDFIVDVNGYFQ
ncbi:MAG TPA: hypothetical protein VFE33_35110 [Thermoanaerobaculia bacterium]|nr:hypothetical protein [Thermoanaerobaculia bacterium]